MPSGEKWVNSECLIIYALIRNIILITLFAISGVSEGSMALTEGEMLSVIELDAGDGWTRVRKPDPDNTEGFVPTTYIQVSLGQQC